MRTIVTFLIHPRTGAVAIKARPRWLFAFGILALASIGLTVAFHGQAVQTTLEHLPGSATPEDKEYIRAALGTEFFSRCAFLPVRLLIGWSGFALLLLYASLSFHPRDSIRFVQVLALEVHAEAILMLARFGTIIWWIVNAPAQSGAIPSPPLSVLWLAWKPADFIFFSLLGSINIFTLWYVLVLTVGIHVLCGFTKRKAFLIVAGVWAVTLGCNLGVLALLRNAFHLHV